MASAYKKWVGNADPQNDWTTELILADGTHVRMGEPVQLSAEMVKDLESKGRIFEDSSAEESKAYHEAPEVAQPVGGDVAGTAPVFTDTEGGVNQDADNDQSKSDKK